MTNHNPVDLPEFILKLLDASPRYIDNKSGAALITKELFPLSHRTIEGWPLSRRRVNGKSIFPTREAIEIAYAKFAAAPVIRSGRHPLQQQAA